MDDHAQQQLLQLTQCRSEKVGDRNALRARTEFDHWRFVPPTLADFTRAEKAKILFHVITKSA